MLQLSGRLIARECVREVAASGQRIRGFREHRESSPEENQGAKNRARCDLLKVASSPVASAEVLMDHQEHPAGQVRLRAKSGSGSALRI